MRNLRTKIDSNPILNGFVQPFESPRDEALLQEALKNLSKETVQQYWLLSEFYYATAPLLELESALEEALTAAYQTEQEQEKALHDFWDMITNVKLLLNGSPEYLASQNLSILIPDLYKRYLEEWEVKVLPVLEPHLL